MQYVQHEPLTMNQDSVAVQKGRMVHGLRAVYRLRVRYWLCLEGIGYATGGGDAFCASYTVYMGALRKNLTYFYPPILVAMANKKKQEYYRNNKKKRLEYQRKYYNSKKEEIAKKRERERAEDPEWQEKQRVYNRAYYIRNKERIMEKRKEKKGQEINRS